MLVDENVSDVARTFHTEEAANPRVEASREEVLKEAVGDLEGV